MKIGVLHPGEMGAAIGAALVRSGNQVAWLSQGRSAATLARAEGAGLTSLSSIDAMTNEADVILSICPPHAAIDVAQLIAASSHRFEGVYIDANAIAPTTAREVAEIVEQQGARYVDGSVIGLPPTTSREETRSSARFFFSGLNANAVAPLFVASGLDVVVIDDSPFGASSLKMSYSGWNKCSQALLLSARSVADYYGVDALLVAEWNRTQPALVARSHNVASGALDKSWRWIGEMEEIAKTFGDADAPEGFGYAAADFFASVVDGSSRAAQVVESLRDTSPNS